MRTLDALARLSDLSAAAFTTNDAAAALRIGRPHASKMLERLAAARQIVRLRRGLWAFPDKVIPLLLPVYLTAPAPCYLSLQSALYFHGMVSQIPQRHYVVSPGRTRLIRTQMGAVSVHHVVPAWFTGFTVDPRTGVPMASPEKALADFLYLAPARSRLFAALPELDLPKGFKWSQVRRFARMIAAPRRRVMVERLLRAIGQKDRRDQPQCPATGADKRHEAVQHREGWRKG
ncbi:MAG: type IV toxin-antitoxin system AbiEi family antitoxin [bacterium]